MREKGRKGRRICNLLFTETKWSCDFLLLAWLGIEYQPKSISCLKAFSNEVHEIPRAAGSRSPPASLWPWVPAAIPCPRREGWPLLCCFLPLALSVGTRAQLFPLPLGIPAVYRVAFEEPLKVSTGYLPFVFVLLQLCVTLAKWNIIIIIIIIVLDQIQTRFHVCITLGYELQIPMSHFMQSM